MVNLFEYTTPRSDSETVTELLRHKKVTINRIVSNTLEESGWYEQEENEWFVLLEGEAFIEFDQEALPLKKGDSMFIPALKRHRVKKTSANALWLSVHIPL